jgi:hypothetical protein
MDLNRPLAFALTHMSGGKLCEADLEMARALNLLRTRLLGLNLLSKGRRLGSPMPDGLDHGPAVAAFMPSIRSTSSM